MAAKYQSTKVQKNLTSTFFSIRVFCVYFSTHTGVAASVYNKYKNETGDDKVTVIASTASPFKFTRAVMGAIDSAYEKEEDFVLVDKLSELGKVEVPNAIEEIRSAAVRHDTVVEVEDMCAEVKRFLGI